MLDLLKCTHKAILACFVELSWFGNVLVRCSEDLRLIAKLVSVYSVYHNIICTTSL